MGKKKSKGKKADVLTVAKLFEGFVINDLQARKRRPQTIRTLRRAIERFMQWRASRSSKDLPARLIRRKHLTLFREWLAAAGCSAVVQNSSVQSIVQVLRAGVAHEILLTYPKLDPIPVRKSAPKVFPRDEEIDRVWDACENATWPFSDSQQRPLHYSASVGFRSALVIYRIYGLRTQELVSFESGFRSLRWENVHPPGITPNPEGREECEHGWISYTPQKQQRVKWQPLYLPLHPCAAAAIDRIKPADCDPSRPVFDWSKSSVGFSKQWRAIFALADVKPRQGSGVDRYTVKHFRKSAYSSINLHRPGIAEHIIGHCSDRSQTGSVVGTTHYFNAESAIAECIRTMPVPSRFSTLLG